jgi:hypothetical protein
VSPIVPIQLSLPLRFDEIVEKRSTADFIFK